GNNSQIHAPSDLSKTTIAAHVPVGQGFTTIAGAGGADGRFSIPKVPEGSYALQIGTRYYVTDKRTLDLETKDLGRPDVVPATNPNTAIAFNVTGLSPWKDGDQLQYFVENANMMIFDVEAAPT